MIETIYELLLIYRTINFVAKTQLLYAQEEFDFDLMCMQMMGLPYLCFLTSPAIKGP